jgi:hypothetical protein
MEYFKGTNKQISPCIASKAKYALKLKESKPSNSKQCSLNYWLKVIDSIAYKYSVSGNLIEESKSKFNLLIKA